MTLRLFGYIALLGSIVLTTACQTTTSSNSTLGEKNPEKAVQLRTQLAAEYIRNGQLDKAKNELDNALTTNSRSVEANAMMGVLLQQEGSPANMKKAEDYFRRALSIESGNAQVRNNYGTYLFQLQRYQEAAEQFKIAGSTLGYQQRYRSLENLGQVYLRLNDKVNAEKSFRQAIQVNRNAVNAKLELAELLYGQQRFTLAGQMYEDYVRSTDQRNQSAQALWLGVRLARVRHDDMGMQVLANQLRAQYPESVEYKTYLQLKNGSEAVWK
ncbi:type IV pilus biogenesis/stability protein PilW [Acinetobacter qingfengensis]|uniref:Type IV pilus biogenesis/stability protein PilW n=1 Tax=Acinetobacter qingfengensis TaxID=1262585 RepID=A0A1E7R1D1_9GAMM|nr:type IV pilus biogenesis/stability protein PilW [Acinetobacter qingfengensis]KAA8733258.1 type IV pilus biogenesis/stability protein PilW [Acinetobacter qingfengensis]OEY93109.1 type IV pilus biogenesis/stability protein PilW [Acinetobacter qingfengensis]